MDATTGIPNIPHDDILMAQHKLDQTRRDRLRTARGTVVQEEFAKRVGLGGQSAVAKIERGITKEIDDDLLEKIAKVSGYSRDWLLTGRGMIPAAEPSATPPSAAAAAAHLSAMNARQPASLEQTQAANSMPAPDDESLSRSDLFDFVGRQKLASVERFMIIAITGESTVKDFLNALEEQMSRQGVSIECQILLRSPYSTDHKRSAAITRTKEALRGFGARYPNFRFAIRTYSSSSPLHAIMCEHRDGTFSGCVSNYLWRSLNARETISTRKPRIRERARENDAILEVYLSWFLHFWGRSKIHTILLDFDDTLFLTTRAQVGAWIHSLTQALDNGLLKKNQLIPELAKALRSKAGADALMTNIFLDHQDEERIVANIFKGVPSRSLGPIRTQRTRKRIELTRTAAEPIKGMITDLLELRSRYQLVIVSATTETLINDILNAHNLGIFSYVIGREALRQQRWQFIENKAQHFIRVSNMLGIPLERMIFVGDSDSDFRAAQQLGLNYIENRHNAARFGRKSLITSTLTPTSYFISKDAEAGELRKQVARIEADIAEV